MEKRSFVDIVLSHFLKEELLMIAVGFVICITAATFVVVLSKKGGYQTNEEDYSTGEIIITFSNGGGISAPFNLEENQVLELPLEVENTKDEPFTYSLTLNHVVDNLKFEVVRNSVTVKSGELKKEGTEDLLSNVFLEGEETHKYIIKLQEN